MCQSQALYQVLRSVCSLPMMKSHWSMKTEFDWFSIPLLPISLLVWKVWENMSETLQLSISLTVTVSSAYDSTIHNSLFTAVLEINFGESDYSIEEGGLGVLSSPITLQFRTNQNPFTVMLSPVTVATAEEMGLGNFIINSYRIESSFRATAGTHSSPTHPR